MKDKFKFENLSEDQKKIVRDQYKLIIKLINFNNKANLVIFKKLFGDKMGEYLCEIWSTKYNRDFLSFYNYLSEDNQSIILSNIELNEQLYY